MDRTVAEVSNVIRRGICIRGAENGARKIVEINGERQSIIRDVYRSSIRESG